jgi:Sulfotransferase family
MINNLPLDILRHTLIIVALRRPADRIVSAFYHLRSLEPKNAYELDFVGLHRFAQRGYQAEDTINRMTKTIAGDYCCYNGNYRQQQFSDREELWNRAVENFRKVGVVLLSEDMRESLQYLAKILGWRNAYVDLHLNPGAKYQHPTNESILSAIQTSNSLDNRLYEIALERFNEQKRILLYGM